MEIKGKIIVVTGGCGFIGSHLVDALIPLEPRKIIVIDNLFLYQNGHPIPVWASGKVKLVVSDASDLEMMRIMFTPGIDLVFNCAVKPLPHSLVDPVDNFNNNVQVVLTLLELLAEERFEKLVHFSSSEIYGSCQSAPMDEGHPIAPSTPYAASKAASDLLALSYFKTRGSNVTILRPFNNYGPRQNEKTYAAIIPRTISRLQEGCNAEIYGNGEQTRDYVYVTDTVRAAILLAITDDEKVRGQVFNVSSGKETSMNDLVTKIRDIYLSISSEETRKILHLDPRKGDVMRHIGDGSKIKNLLGFEPRISLDFGLRRAIEWYMQGQRGEYDISWPGYY